ncbi:MAG: hypothetical protein ACFB15_12995 [Cyclobacteriaceae bacterium]
MNYRNQLSQRWDNVSKRTILTLSLLILGCASAYTQKKQEVEFVGSVRLFQVGDCTISEDPRNVKLVVGVNSKTKTLTVKEFQEDESGTFQRNKFNKWSGEILNDVCLRLQAVADIECEEGKRTETLHFIGMINCSEGGNSCTMKLEDTFAMCPASNCIFSIEYDLKTNSIER